MAIKTIYDENETMKLIGQQRILSLIGAGGIAKHDFLNMVNAETIHNQDLYTIAGDAFTLGYIYGKRAERAKRK